MNSINPVLSSVTSTAQMQSNSAIPSEDQKMTDQPAATNTAAGNTTVTLSEQAQRLSQADLQLQARQTVQSSESIDNRTIEQNQVDNRTTNSTNLQSQNQYAQMANELVEPSS